LREAILRREFVLLVGNCTVEYEGRAASHLGEGERILIIKGDGSVLIHRPFGYEPVNWHPPNSKIEVSSAEDAVTITATRAGERLVVSFTSVKHFASFQLRDEAEFQMYASEAEMKKAVLLEPSLIEEGFSPYEEERQAFGSGRMDILGTDADGKLVVVELKRREASAQDVAQLLGYVNSLERELGSRPRAVIAAPSMTRQATRAASQAGIEFRCLTPRRCMEVLRQRRGLKAFLTDEKEK